MEHSPSYQPFTSARVRRAYDQFPAVGKEGVAQAIIPYFSVLSSKEISRFIKQKQGNQYWLHEEGADTAARVREGLREA